MKTTTQTGCSEINVARFWAPTVTTDGQYKIVDGKGRTIMFSLTTERAAEFAKHYRGAQIVAM